jgi:hypothetical protein
MLAPIFGVAACCTILSYSNLQYGPFLMGCWCTISPSVPLPLSDAPPDVALEPGDLSV